MLATTAAASPGRAHRSQEYQDAIIRAWREKNPSQQEHPLYYDTVYDLWRAVDYLGSRSDVDPTRIGTFGFSMGGIKAWLAAGTDERIRVVVIALAAQSFQWNLEHDAWQGRARTLWRAHEAAAKDLGEAEVNAKVCRALWNKVTPGILDEFNCLKMLSAIAPRRLLILNREDDVNAPLEGAKLAFAAAQDAYKKARAEDHLKIDVAPGSDHNTTPEQEKLAYAWLERCLKP